MLTLVVYSYIPLSPLTLYYIGKKKPTIGIVTTDNSVVNIPPFVASTSSAPHCLEIITIMEPTGIESININTPSIVGFQSFTTGIYRIAIAAAIKQKGVILGGDLNILTFANEFDPSFMALCITNSGTHYELSRFAQGKSVVHLRNNDIANGHVVCPALAEQQQIAAFFLNMDKQIRIQEQRLEKLKQIKSACLNNMFV